MSSQRSVFENRRSVVLTLGAVEADVDDVAVGDLEVLVVEHRWSGFTLTRGTLCTDVGEHPCGERVGTHDDRGVRGELHQRRLGESSAVAFPDGGGGVEISL